MVPDRRQAERDLPVGDAHCPLRPRQSAPGSDTDIGAWAHLIAHHARSPQIAVNVGKRRDLAAAHAAPGHEFVQMMSLASSCGQPPAPRSASDSALIVALRRHAGLSAFSENSAQEPIIIAD